MMRKCVCVGEEDLALADVFVEDDFAVVEGFGRI